MILPLHKIEQTIGLEFPAKLYPELVKKSALRIRIQQINDELAQLKETQSLIDDEVGELSLNISMGLLKEERNQSIEELDKLI